MNGNNSDPEALHLVRMKGLIQRLFFLRGRFRAVLPSNVERFKSQAVEDDSGGKIPQLFFLLGIMITRQGEPITMGEISRAMDVPLSTATRIVDWFVRNDYARRLPDPEDRRIVRIAWTEAGQEVYQAMIAHATQRLDELLAHFTGAERDQFVCLMEKVANILEQEA